MKFLRPPIFGASTKANGFPLSNPLTSSQVIPSPQLNGNEFLSKLLDRRWALHSPATPIHQIKFSYIEGNLRDGQIGKLSFSNNTCPCLGNELMEDNQGPAFYVLRDDLLHPLVNGNKARKLDALLPLLEDHSVTDVVTCGGCQSAHTAAVAISCAERGLKSHLLLCGEQLQILTGYNLVSTLYGNVTYITRSKYAHREQMLKTHANIVAGKDGQVLWCEDIVEASLKDQNFMNLDFAEMIDSSTSKNTQRKVVIVNEGAGDGIALLGMFRLASYLSRDHLLGRNRALKFVIDAGTGTTAVGLGLAAMLLGLPWEINAVMLADTPKNYRKHEKQLISEFKRQFHPQLINGPLFEVDGNLVNWIERQRPRKRNGLMPRYCTTDGYPSGSGLYLAAFEMSTLLAHKEAEGDSTVIMLHTGGNLGLFGLAQRYKSYFHRLKDRTFCSGASES